MLQMFIHNQFACCPYSVRHSVCPPPEQCLNAVKSDWHSPVDAHLLAFLSPLTISQQVRKHPTVLLAYDRSDDNKWLKNDSLSLSHINKWCTMFKVVFFIVGGFLSRFLRFECLVQNRTKHFCCDHLCGVIVVAFQTEPSKFFQLSLSRSFV